METHTLNIRDVARELGIPDKESTIRLWYKEFGLPSEVRNRQRLFSADLLPIFRRIQDMKAQALEKETIQANVQQDLQELGLKPKAYSPDAQTNNQASEVARLLREQMQEHNQALLDTFKNVVAAEMDHSQALAQVSEQLGYYKGLAQTLQQQLLEAQAAAKQLPEKAQSLLEAEHRAKQAELQHQQAARELERSESMRQAEAEAMEARAAELEQERMRASALEEDLARIRAQLDQTQAEKAGLASQLEAEQAKSWWDKITKK